MTYQAKTWKLPCGIKVVFEENHNAEVISLQIGVKVGSRNEAKDESGMCHLIEHMVFKGTTSFAVGEIASLVESHGGELNAYTSLDQTVYYINLPSQHTELGLQLLKEMVFDASFDEVELEREKEVVVEEIKRGLDSPQRILGQTVFSNSYKTHPYRQPVIGTTELVKGFSPQKIKNFYKKHYTPDQMILAVCGHVSEAHAKKLIDDVFRSVKKNKHSLQNVAVESFQQKFSLVTNSISHPATLFEIAFKVPQLTHPDTPILDILSYLLGEADTSLLEQNVKERQQLVHQIYTSNFSPKDPGLFFIGGHVDPDKINEALASIVAEVEKTKTEDFFQEDLERAKRLAKSQIIYDKQTCEGTTRKWVTYETTCDDFKYEDHYLQVIQNVTVADLKRVASQYLNFSAAVVAVLHPHQTKLHIDKNIFVKTQKIKKIPFTILKKSSQAKVYQLPNQLRVVLKENKRLPIFSLKMASLGGLKNETAQNNGIHHLISHLLTKGTQDATQIEIAKKCEDFCGSISGYTGRNSWGTSLNCLADKKYEALSLFASVVLRPLLSQDDIKKEKVLQKEAIKNQLDNPAQLVFQNAMKIIFPEHPYSYSILGTQQSLKKLTHNVVRDFYADNLSAKNTVFAAVGDFDSQTLLEKLHYEFGSLKSPTQKEARPAKIKPLQKREEIFTIKDKNQAHIVIGFAAPSLHSQDKYHLDVIHSILSGQGGRLFLDLRDKQSLAYTVTTSFIQGVDTSFFSAYIATDPKKVDTAIEELTKQLQRIQVDLVSSAELERAKNYIIGNHEIDHQKNSAVAMQLALNELYEFQLADFFEFSKHIQKINRHDIIETAKKYLTLDRCVISVVGPKGCFSGGTKK